MPMQNELYSRQGKVTPDNEKKKGNSAWYCATREVNGYFVWERSLDNATQVLTTKLIGNYSLANDAIDAARDMGDKDKNS